MFICCQTDRGNNASFFNQYAPYLSIVATVFLGVSGWVVVAYRNRRHEIFKKRLDLRIETAIEVQKFFDAINVYDAKENNSYYKQSKQITTSLTICGSKAEIDLWTDFEYAFADYLIDLGNTDKQKEAVQRYVDVRLKLLEFLRKDLGVEPLKGISIYPNS